MKFYCDSCNAKYLISDEKVAGKILKIKCKKCQHIMVVRETTEVQAGRGAYSPAEAPKYQSADDVEWFYAVAGQTYGPHNLAELRTKFATGQLGDEAYVWNHTMPGWIPATDAPEFTQLFQRGVVRKPSKPTMTLSVMDVQSVAKHRLGHTDSGSDLAISETRPESSTSNILKRASNAHSRAVGTPILSRPGARGPAGVPQRKPQEGQGSAQARSLEKLRIAKEAMTEKYGESTRQQSVGILRDRLKEIRKQSAAKNDPKAPDQGPSSGSLRDRVEALKAHAGRDDPSTVQADIPREILASAVPEREEVDDTAQMSIDELAGGSADSVSIDDTRQVDLKGSAELIARSVDPDPTKQYKVSDAMGTGPDAQPSQPQVPTPAPEIVAPAPEISAEAPQKEDPAAIVDQHRVLPGLDDIEKKASTVDPLPKIDRAPKIVLGAGSGELPALSAPSIPMISEGSGAMSRSLLIQLDTIKRQNRGVRMIAFVGFVGILLLGGVGVVVAYLFLDGDRFADLKEADRAAQAKLEAEPSGKTDFNDLKGYKPDEFAGLIELPESTEPEPELTFDEDTWPLVTEKKKRPATNKSAKTTAPAIKTGPALKGTLAKVEEPPAAPKDKSPMSVYESLASNRPKYKVEKAQRNPVDNAAPSLPDTLKREDLVRGFRNVRRSADQCLERHIKRQGRLPKGKVKVVVTINGNGRVSGLNMDREVSNTLFDSCMRAHKSRWRFPEFSGKPLLVSRVFVLQ